MKTQDVKISEILHFAADHCLYDGHGMFDKGHQYSQYSYSCCAVQEAIRILIPSPFHHVLDPKTLAGKMWVRIRQGFFNLGLRAGSTTAYDEFDSPSERQQSRYAWLKFAAMLAEEQGQ